MKPNSYNTSNLLLTSDYRESISEDEFAITIDEVIRANSASDKLVELLEEQHPFYSGKTMNQVNRMRGYIFSQFSRVGICENALPYVFEELESGRDAYILAAAARAIRSSKLKTSEMGKFLVRGLQNITHLDTILSFDSYYQQWPMQNPTSATEEIIQSLSWLGSEASDVLPDLEDYIKNNQRNISRENLLRLNEAIQVIKNDESEKSDFCCTGYADARTKNRNLKYQHSKVSPGEILLEDQDEQKTCLDQFVKNKISLIAFIYTRCDNPLKCSLTVTKMAEIQGLLEKENLGHLVNMALISYDSFYDLPYRLKVYAEARDLKLNQNTKVFRSVSDFSLLRDYFNLGVNFTGELVNRHIIELFVLDGKGAILKTFLRKQINAEEVIRELKFFSKPKTGLKKVVAKTKIIARSVHTLLTPVLIFFLPKCPFCFAAYFSMLGITGAQFMPYVKYLFPFLITAIAINLYSILKMSRSRKDYFPFLLCLTGSLLIIISARYIPGKIWLIGGIVLLCTGTLMNNFPDLSKFIRKRISTL